MVHNDDIISNTQIRYFNITLTQQLSFPSVISPFSQRAFSPFSHTRPRSLFPPNTKIYPLPTHRNKHNHLP